MPLGATSQLTVVCSPMHATFFAAAAASCGMSATAETAMSAKDAASRAIE
jgi:hypothetical protein